MSPLDLHRIPHLHTQDGGHEFRNGHVFPFEPHSCSLCGGDCPTPIACELPEPGAVPSQQITGELWAGFIGAVLGMAALALYGHEFIRQFLNP